MSEDIYPNIGLNNKIILKSASNQTIITNRLDRICIKIEGNNNTIMIHESSVVQFNISLNIYIRGNNNLIEFSDKVRGKWNITEYDDNNILTVGENTDSGGFSISLHGNTCRIGKNCMISAEEELWTDGHSVIDAISKEVLNVPKDEIIIGDHVWIGRRCTFTKGASVPNDCIIGIASVVTRKFTESHCVIAGNPAQIVKKGISWNGLRPSIYYEKQKSGEIKLFRKE